MKDNNKLFSWSDARIYLILFLALTIMVVIKNPLLGFICLLVYGYIIYHTYVLVEEKNKELVEDIESLADNFESATKYAIFNMPFPLVMLNSNGDINWYNTPFLNMLEGKDILNKNIKKFIPAIDLGKSDSNKDTEIEVENISYNDKDYLVYFNYINNKKSVTSGDRLVLLYWVDNTKYKDLQIEFDKSKPVVSLVYIDNYEDVKSNTIEVNRPLVLAEIDTRIRDYFNKYNTVVRKYENSKYLVFMDNESLNEIQDKKFDLLDDLRELDIGNKIPITLSIGVSTTEKSLEESYKNARAAIDIALGRGGDQAVLNNNGKFEFFGGKSKALEKRNKVKARVIGYALKQLITQADNVVIMGHTNPDMDAFGSAIGVLRGVKNINKPGYIVLNEINPSIKNIYNKMKIDQEELVDHFITTEKAEQIITKNTLMVLVDNHKPSFTEAPELLDLVEKVVIIDHHRRGTEFVKDPVLTYLEPYASSASELVTEILTYMTDNISLTKFEAEALLAGITVDTKNFSFQTGVRTFEAASTLKRSGADTTAVRQLFRDDYETFIDKANVVSSSEIVEGNVAIGILDKDDDDSVLIAAQSANELLDINGMEASFVLTYIDDKIHISGRSLGNISVQLILEELGGGGHLTSAGVQLKDMSMDEAKQLLIEAIKKHIKDGVE